MEEYIKKLLEQVRFKKAHRGIAEEIRAHIEDQIDDNMAAGMDREAAEKAAIEDMGDPVEVGISMDRVHRPQIAWTMVLGAVVVGIIGCVIHMLLMYNARVLGAEGYATVAGKTLTFSLFTILGIITMLLVYFMDYTVIARFSKIIAIALFALVMIGEDELGIFAVIAAVGGLLVAGFIASSKTKNQLGMVMGSGCMMALLASALVNMGAAFGIIQFFSSFFPFISADGSNLLVSYAFLGIIMSIYKYKTAYPQHMDIDIRGKIKLGKIEFIKN